MMAWFTGEKVRRVLIIDDSASVRAMVEARLETDGLTVDAADDARSGLAAARSLTPDLILLDWMLPDQSGINVLHQLKADPHTSSIVVYMMTSKNLMGNVEQALAKGADGYITKPFSLRELSQKVAKALGKESG